MTNWTLFLLQGNYSRRCHNTEQNIFDIHKDSNYLIKLVVSKTSEYESHIVQSEYFFNTEYCVLICHEHEPWTQMTAMSDALK
jgi:hypothetical protein